MKTNETDVRTQMNHDSHFVLESCHALKFIALLDEGRHSIREYLSRSIDTVVLDM
jgi:hypothetical protein